MTDIKMRDVFSIPVGCRVSNASFDYVLFDRCNTIHLVGGDKVINSVVSAINAYDDNQKRIKELEEWQTKARDSNQYIDDMIEQRDFLKRNRKSSPTITAGCYCTDIENEQQYIDTCEALIKLGADSHEYTEYSYASEYEEMGNVGWHNDGDIFHAVEVDDKDTFTTLVSHKDIIKAAEGL